MSASTLISIIAIVLSLLSVVTSAALAWRQVHVSQHANELPVIFEFMKEISSESFQKAESYLLTQLKEEYSSELGYSNLPETPRIAANKVTWYFNTLGVLVALKIVSEPIVIPLFGYRARRLWQALEPFIAIEREIRGDYYAAFYEDLICRINDNWPPAEAYNITLKRLAKFQNQTGIPKS